MSQKIRLCAIAGLTASCALFFCFLEYALPQDAEKSAVSIDSQPERAKVQNGAQSRRANAKAAYLAEAAKRKGALLARELDKDCAVVVHAPFVIGGDMSHDELDAWYRDTIAPAAEAFANQYFDTPPDEPITVHLFSGEASYNRYAKRLFADENVSVYGYYKPDRRTLVMNIGTGGGTLVHELAHALMAFDFPDVPDWFNEGLASLYEQSRFGRKNGRRTIEGLVNWRLPKLQEAIRAGKLGSLEALITSDDFRGRNVGLNYAHARYFCMYLQERGRLADYYRAFRDHRNEDPRGLSTARNTLGEKWDTLDGRFQEWVLQLER